MARPIKRGIDYYPLDVKFLRDIKVRKILRACSDRSIAVLISLLGNVYEDNGYYAVWDNDTSFLIADEIGVSEGLVTEVVNKAVQVEFFDSKKFDEYKILTSKGIQERYLEATNKRKQVEIVKEYLVLDINVVNNLVNVCINSINDGRSTQSKEKESKVNKTKEKKSNQEFIIFEEAWELYPNKKGKNAVNKKSKQDIEKLGLEAMTQAINNYILDVTNQRKNGFTTLNYVNGSTFFNGRYEDYLTADNITPLEIKTDNNATQNYFNEVDSWV